MNEGPAVFAQLMDEPPQYEFDKCVRRYSGMARQQLKSMGYENSFNLESSGRAEQIDTKAKP